MVTLRLSSSGTTPEVRDDSASAGYLAVTARRTAASLWLVTLIVVVLYAFVASVRYGWQIASIWRGEFGARTSTSQIPLQLRNASPFLVTRSVTKSRDTLDLRGKTALVLLYDNRCPACKDNMPRWMDLLAELRRRDARIPVFAISDDPLDAQRNYWNVLQAAVDLRQPLLRSAMGDNFGTTSIPSTVVVRQGKVVAVQTGAIGPWRREFLLRQLLDK